MHSGSKIKVLMILELKNREINQFLKFNTHISKEDFDDVIKNWSDEDCDKIVKRLEDFFAHNGSDDKIICLWYVKNRTCSNCSYIKRHDTCSYQSISDYYLNVCQIEKTKKSKHYSISVIDNINKLFNKIKKILEIN